MNVSVLLADKGLPNREARTLHLLNVGWSARRLNGPITEPFAVAVFLEAPLEDCNRDLVVVLELVGDDGPIELPGPAGPQPMRLTHTLRCAPPPGAPTGTPGKANFLIELVPGLPLPPGVYSWRVSVDGKKSDDWSTTFWLASQEKPPSFGA